MASVRADLVAVYVYRRTPLGGVEFLQLRRAAHDSCGNSWAVVYGGVEAGETAVQAALRELREETGLSPRFLQQVEYVESFYFRSEDRIVLTPVFVAEVDAGAVVVMNGEHEEHRWVPSAQVSECFMWRTQRECIAIIEDQLRHPGPAAAFLTVLDERSAQ